MENISPQLVKELREKTGAGMGDCKKALVDAKGDIKGAIEILRKKGAASAVKRADRSANEGLIALMTSQDHKRAVIAEINSETDFVAKNSEFEKFSAAVASALIINDAQNLQELMSLKIDGDTIKGIYDELLAKLGEKIEVRRFEILKTDGYFAEYLHAGSKLGVLVEVNISNPTVKVQSMIRDIAMQVAAMNPSFIDRTLVTQEILDKEKEIYTQLAVTEGKKPEIAEKIAAGRLEKFFQEQCLVEQTFVKDPNNTIADLLKEIAQEAGTEVKIIRFRRYFLGESLD